MAATEAQRYAYIDTLRGLAASYVLLYHLALTASPPLAVPSNVSWLILNGGTGVTLFFVASAFTLCGSMAARAGDTNALGDYAIRRFFRIVPLFYVWLALSWLRDAYIGARHPLGSVLYNLTFTYNFVKGEESSFVWAGWTLGVEMIFYLVFPFLFRMVTNVPRAVVLVLASVGLVEAWPRLAGVPGLRLLNNAFTQFGFFRMLPLFAVGMLAFHIHRRYIRGQARSAGLSLALVVGSFAGYYGLLYGYLGTWANGMLFLQAPIYALLLLGLAIVPWPPIVNRVTVFLGVISYSLYLNHTSVIWVFGPVFQWIYRQPLPLSVKWWSCATIAMALATLASYVSYRLIEQPGMRLGSWLIARRRLRQPLSQVAPA